MRFLDRLLRRTDKAAPESPQAESAGTEEEHSVDTEEPRPDSGESTGESADENPPQDEEREG
jgi:hypothetical protein